MLHSLHLFTSEAGWFHSHPGFERFVLCPDSAVENLEGCLLGLGRKQWHGENFVGIEEGVSPGEHHTVPLAGQVRGRHVHLLVKLVSQLSSEDLTQILFHEEEGGASSG
jgi:hypothetical protein